MCDTTSCQISALQQGISYKKLQKASLELILSQVDIIKCALQNCSATTYSDLTRASRVITTQVGLVCNGNLLLNDSAASMTAALNGPQFTTVQTTSSLGTVYTNPVPLPFAVAGTNVVIGSDSIPVSAPTLYGASDTASLFSSTVQSYKCGMYGCFSASYLNTFTLSGSLGALTLGIVDPASGNVIDSFTTPVAANPTGPYNDLASSINGSSDFIATASVIGGVNSLTITACSGDTVALNNSAGAYNILIFNGVETEIALTPATQYFVVGVVNTYYPNPYYISLPGGSPLSNTTPVIASPINSTELLASYCPTYTTVKTITCGGSIYLTLQAPNVPFTALLTTISNFISSPGTCTAPLLAAICKLVCLLQAYITNDCRDADEYMQMERNIYLFSKCTPSTTACTPKINMCELRKERVAYQARHK